MQWQVSWRRGAATGGREQLIDSLRGLRAELARHLAEEESGGCVEEAALHAPRLTCAAQALEREDPRLLEQLDELILRLQAAPRGWRKMEQDYRQLAKQICQHVAAESRILEESFHMQVD